MNAVSTKDKNKAYTSNYPVLERWLDGHGARCNWQLLRGKLSGNHAYVESWSIDGREFIVVVQSHQHGWEIYTSAGVMRVDETLEDANERLDLPSVPPVPRPSPSERTPEGTKT